MTREEAKRYFVERVQMLVEGADRFPPIPLMAYEMAIETLQAQPTHGRLIDADALIEDFNKLNEWLDLDEETEIVSLINNAPTVQADRPQGKWIRISDDWIDGTCGARYFPIRCSVCGYSTYDDDAKNFCPDCGADMRKEKE